MPSNFHARLLAFFAAIAIPATLVAEVIPPIGLPPGSQYKLIFVTAGTRDATSGNIAEYNAFVTSQAGLNPLIPLATWQAVASTGQIEANVNAPSQFGQPIPFLPVYNTAGQLVIAEGQGLYRSTNVLSNNPIAYDQFGGFSSVSVWTGSTSLGHGFDPMGTSIVGYGNSIKTDGNWAHAGSASATASLHLYALSSAITVPVPEPATLVLFGIGAVGLFVAVRRMKHPQRVPANYLFDSRNWN